MGSNAVPITRCNKNCADDPKRSFSCHGMYLFVCMHVCLLIIKTCLGKPISFPGVAVNNYIYIKTLNNYIKAVFIYLVFCNQTISESVSFLAFSFN